MILVEKHVYFWKKKFQVLNAFKKFKSLVEKESSYNIKVMKSNRGGDSHQ